MIGEKISVTLPDPLLRAARDVAAHREVTLQQLLRDGLTAEVARFHRKAKSPVRADERTIAMLRARFANDFAYANSWGDLLERLRGHHTTLREAGGGLVVVGLPSGARLCKASDVGASLNKLARRFHAPFPGEKRGHGALFSATTHPEETAILDRDRPPSA